MRIILKPGGVLLILGAFSALVALFVLQQGLTTPASARPTKGSILSSDSKGGIPLLENGDFSQGATASWTNANGTPTTVKEESQNGSQQFLRMKVVPEGPDSWHTNLGQVIHKPLKTGDHIVFRGWFRSPESLVIHLYVEETEKPHSKTASAQVYVTPQWREQSVEGTVIRDFLPGEAQLMIHFGVLPGTVEMANFRLENYGQTTTPTASPTPSASVPAVTKATAL